MASKDVIFDHLKTLCQTTEAGTLLPSVRELSREFAVSPVTITRALAELSDQGWVETKPGNGTFVRKRVPPKLDINYDWQTLVLGPPPAVGMSHLVMATPPGALHFASGYMDNSVLPERELARASRS